jgi:hypothetical protein
MFSLRVGVTLSDRTDLQPLSRRKAVYRTLVKAVTDCAIYMLDSNRIVSSWNRSARRSSRTLS